jgi:hypothetical protein
VALPAPYVHLVEEKACGAIIHDAGSLTKSMG